MKRLNGGSPLNAPVAETVTGLVVLSASIGTALPHSHHFGPTVPTSDHGHRQAQGHLPRLLLRHVYRQESYGDLQFPELLRQCRSQTTEKLRVGSFDGCCTTDRVSELDQLKSFERWDAQK
ncbi:hypothetical protein MRX96_058862 [Rhipicephalus microplus]